MHEDIYFLSPKEALRVASQQNRWGENNYYLQLCYYEGEKIESDLANLVHLPIENLLETLAYGTYRIPSKIDFTGLEISSDIKLEVLMNFNLSIEQAKMYRTQLNTHYLQKMKNSSPDFSERLRFHLCANVSTQVMQYVSKNIANTLRDMGYEVCFELYEGIEDLSSFKIMSEFQPHATININNLNNTFLSDSIFNFVWFQDPMPILYDESKIHLRQRDIIYALSDMIMKKKFIKESYEIQRFCVSKSDFYRDETIQKENKIIFIGSSYAAVLNKEISDKRFRELYNIFRENLNTGMKITPEYVGELSRKYEIDYNLILLSPLAMAVRECSVEWICKQKNIAVEVYGRHWENNPLVAPYFKGELPHGKELSKVYNSARYSVYAHSFDMYQQRLPEMAACGTIPVSYDCRAMSEEKYDYEENTLLFSNYEELVDILGEEPKKNVYGIAEEMSFNAFVTRMVKKIEQEVG
ncbi:hypothetical protein KKG72_10560 [bacterium]|nr:hypothetical protein [bacterium]MBU1994491.1 hypothetical protein [bacterium]